MNGNRIQLEGLANTRDLGGYRTTDGQVIRPARLYRSGALFSATDSDIKKLTGSLNLGLVIDFRTPAEQEQRPDPVMPGVKWISNPILDEETVGITFEEQAADAPADMLAGLLKLAESLEGRPELYMDQLYRSLILSDMAAARYAGFFDLLLEGGEKAALWHCTAGKDRVGIGTALLLTALGADRETVFADYELTNHYLRAEADEAASKVLKYTGNIRTADCIRVFLTVSSQYIRDAFETAKEGWGSVEQYLVQQVGLTADKRDRLRECYLMPGVQGKGSEETEGEHTR